MKERCNFILIFLKFPPVQEFELPNWHISGLWPVHCSPMDEKYGFNACVPSWVGHAYKKMITARDNTCRFLCSVRM